MNRTIMRSGECGLSLDSLISEGQHLVVLGNVRERHCFEPPRIDTPVVSGSASGRRELLPRPRRSGWAATFHTRLAKNIELPETVKDVKWFDTRKVAQAMNHRVLEIARTPTIAPSRVGPIRPGATRGGVSRQIKSW